MEHAHKCLLNISKLFIHKKQYKSNIPAILKQFSRKKKITNFKTQKGHTIMLSDFQIHFYSNFKYGGIPREKMNFPTTQSHLYSNINNLTI
jgi:hypothetical protein